MGKAFQQRRCPAVGREISAADCGDHRVSRHACPADCEHNPFAAANYARLLEIEDGLDKKTLNWLFADASDRPALAQAFRCAVDAGSPHAAHAFTSWRLFFHQGADGLTCAQRWERAGFLGLKNDERVLFRSKMQTRIALLEIHAVLDEQRLEAIDLFSPNRIPFRVVDRRLARQAVRFVPLVAWVFPLPHFWRVAGTALEIPDWGPFEPDEIVIELARHLGGPAEPEPLRRWLAEHFVRLSEGLDATARERRKQMLAQLDAKWGSVVYELRAPFAECRALLDAGVGVAVDELDGKERSEGFAEARTWFDASDTLAAALPEGGRPVLGRLLLGQTFWRIEAMGGDRLARLRENLETGLGNRVRFTSERLDDLGTRLAMSGPQGNPALVPPRLLEHAERLHLISSQVPMPTGGSAEEMLAETEQAYLRAFPDRPVPALDGRTPREAAGDPALRPKLLRLMKSQVRDHDRKNLQTGRDADINWLLRELGLKELDGPPPPLRSPLETAALEDLEPLDEEDELLRERDDGPNAYSPEPDPLPDKPIELDEAARRLNKAMEEFDTAAEALNELEASGATLVPDVSELTADLLSDTEFSCLLTFLLQAWFALVPPGCRAPRLRLPAMREAMRQDMGLVTPGVISGSLGALQGVVSNCRQPALLQALIARLFDSTKKMPKDMRPTAEARVAMVVILKVVLNELDHALRHP